MVTDQLSRIFDVIEVRGVLTGGLVARGPWVSRAAVSDVEFLAVVAGQVRLTVETSDDPISLGPGDVVVLNGRSRVELRGAADGRPREVEPEDGFESLRRIGFPSALVPGQDVLVGGRVDLNPVGRSLLGQALPPVAHVRGAGTAGAHVRGSVHRLLDELADDRMGAEHAIRQHTQILLLEVLRSVIEHADLPSGWLRALADPRLRPALDAIHAEPSRTWSLTALARTAAMSRTSFAERFREQAGVPPITYLHRWRIVLAQRALRDGDTRVAALADQLGYASESSFSNAFKREVGVSPLGSRRQVLGTSRPESAGASI